MAEGLRLEVREFTDLTRWRWVLTDGRGTFLADHEVRIDTRDWQHEAFAGLRHYVSWHAAPDRYAADEARIAGEVGAWAGAHVLGPVADALLARRPATVAVLVPPEAEPLAFRPLELAHAGGRPLSLQNVNFVFSRTDHGDSPALTASGATATIPDGGRLRILGLFSLPEGGQPLSLRRERHCLVRLVHAIAAGGKAADVRVLQYGVTRARLKDVLEEAEGWDIIHISGHGAPGELLLETETGAPDLVTADELASLLDLARERVQLVTVAACWSAAITAGQQRRLLGLPVPDSRSVSAVPAATVPAAGESADRSGDAASPPGALATELAGRLGCAVLAMRFPVDDEFAIALSGELYRLLAGKGQPLPRAVGMALRELADGGYPALSLAAPAIFGERAVGLTLAAPPRERGGGDYDTGSLKMAGFPPQPDRFVGRTGVMARASAALAAESGIPGVLLHGMPGGGKTACATELAYTHEHAFDRLVWYKAPDEGMAIDGALTDFALTLEQNLPGFQMIHVLADEKKLTAFLPTLTELAEQRRALIVIDNAESLLTSENQWRNDQWCQVIGALTAHRGLGRVILTTRHVPAAATELQAEAVDALSADEALLLSRELPHLRKLINGEIPGIGPEEARRLALGVLNIAQGHPKLLELADGQAAHPERLAALIQSGGEAWQQQGGLPAGFFTASEPSASPGDYLNVLAAWTRTVTDTLSPAERDLFWFLCCLEEPDRELGIIEVNWPDLWTHLGRDGEPPDLDQTLYAVADHGLTSITDTVRYCSIHPGVAAAGRAHAGKSYQNAIDAEAIAFWTTVVHLASGGTDDGELNSEMLVRAGLAAAPYLMRQQEWKTAAALLEEAFVLEPSRANAAAMLPAIEQITCHYPASADMLPMVLRVTDPAAAETLLRASLNAATDSGDFRRASVAAEQLADQCLVTGRLTEALALARQRVDYTRRAGHGPWTRLLAEVQRLRVLNGMGQASQVLDEVRRLREHMRNLSATHDPDGAIPPWHVREALLDTGGLAAMQLSRWDDVLALNAEQIACMQDRLAPVTKIAQIRFNGYGALLRLGHTNEALNLLRKCYEVFQDAHDIEMIGKTLAAFADTENIRGHSDAAVRLGRNALRYAYQDRDVAAIAANYHNLGVYLRRQTHQPVSALSSHLVSALICAITDADSDDAVHEAVIDLRAFGTAAVLPTDVADLCHIVGDIPGTDPADLIARLSSDPQTAEDTLQTLIAQVRELAEGDG